MFLAVLGVMQKYQLIWAAMTKIADMVGQLESYTDRIKESSGMQGTPLTGISGGKRRKRMEMMETAFAIAGDLHALATDTGDADLQAKTDLQLNVVRLGEQVVGARCEDIHTLAVTNAAALAPYGTDAAAIAALNTAMDEFTTLLTAPRQAVVGRKEVTSDIAEDEDAADELLKKQLDRSMRKFKTTEPSFFGEYTSARMIIDLGTRHEKEEPPSAGRTTP
jgi:hypothetical protein